MYDDDLDVPPEWLDRSDDYNVFEEQQVFLDREGEDEHLEADYEGYYDD